MAQLLSPLAKALNAMDDLRGQVWERRYSAIEILDEVALVDPDRLHPHEPFGR